jgi:5'-methylthioadenosine phosphorylase
MPQTKKTPKAEIAVIGGSGLYDIEGMTRVKEVRVTTPFGAPSDHIVLGELDGVRVAFLARHGRGHRWSPSEINYRANIYALKSLGVTRIISVSAVGSMKEHVKPGDVVLPQQFIDLTKHRASTFFDKGIVAHVAFNEPICHQLSRAIQQAAQGLGAVIHSGGVYLCIEGPQFSSLGESLLYRQWGVDVIGMTNLPEAKLAREAEICYATMALVTDFDCWHQSEASVTVEAILAILHNNVEMAKRVIRNSLAIAQESRVCACGSALQYAIVTAPAKISQATKKRLDVLIGGYLPGKKGAV